MALRIELKSSAVRDLASLPKGDQVKVARKINALADNPYPRGSKKLAGVEDLRRIRVGRYRILYQVRQQTLVVCVVRIKHRRDVYRP